MLQCLPDDMGQQPKTQPCSKELVTIFSKTVNSFMPVGYFVIAENWATMSGSYKSFDSE